MGNAIGLVFALFIDFHLLTYTRVPWRLIISTGIVTYLWVVSSKTDLLYLFSFRLVLVKQHRR